MLHHRGRKLIAAINLFQRYQNRRGPWAWLMRNLGKLQHEILTVLTASDIPRTARIAESVRMPHPNGIVLHPNTIIGENCLINQQVTIGMKGSSGAPVIERDVFIGTGAKVLGDVTVGTGAKIGANAVVLIDVPAGATAVGVPARILPCEAKSQNPRE